VKRGDFVIVSAPGDFGKPRPALVIQSDYYDATATLTVLLVSSDVIDAPGFRIPIGPTPGNGLRLPSQIQVDKCFAMPRHRIGQRIGEIDRATLVLVNGAVAGFFGIA
jgi:mRNA interferase MazF